MNALDTFSAEELSSALRTRIESSLYNGETHMRFSLSSVLKIEEDLSKAILNLRWIRNTFAPVNKLHPELLAVITTFSGDPFGGTRRCENTQFFCAMVCRYWRSSLLAFPGIWSSVDTTNRNHLEFYLARSKKALLRVNYGHRTSPGTFEQYIIPERRRLQSLSIPLSDVTHREVTQSLSGVAESLKELDLWTVFHAFHVPVTTLETIARFARNIMVLRLHDITASLVSLEFPALVKLTFRLTVYGTSNPDAEDLVNFLKHSPVLEELDLQVPKGFEAGVSADTAVTLAHLKSAVFSGSSTPENTIDVNVLPCLRLPDQSVTVDVQTRVRAFSSDTSPLPSVIQLGAIVLHRQSITAAAIHIKDNPSGFFGHVSICGERNNWIGLNHSRILNIGKSPLSRLRNWLHPASLAQLRGIRTLTLGLFKFASDEEVCVGVLRTFLQGLGQVRTLNIYKMDVSLVARILEPSGGQVLPLLEELKLHPYDPPEITRSEAYANVRPGPSEEASPSQVQYLGMDPEGIRVSGWRHRLQKMLLSGHAVREEDMHACDEVFKELEDYEMTLDYLKFSKIGKIMRHIKDKDDIPRQQEFGFQERARAILKEWNRVLALGYGSRAGRCEYLNLRAADGDLPIIRDILRARSVIGSGGLKEVIVVNASGGTTSVTIPRS